MQPETAPLWGISNAEFAELWATYAPAEEIASRAGTSVENVRARAVRQGLKRPPRLDAPILRRLLSKAERVDSGCLLWRGVLTPAGYGVIKVRVGNSSLRRAAHRLAYEAQRGAIPEGLVLDHLCRVRNCIEVTHLEAVTQRTNVLRGIGPSAKNARKSRCQNGHSFDAPNTRFDRFGKRRCRSCDREAKRAEYWCDAA